MNPERWVHLAGALAAVMLARGTVAFLAAHAVTGLAKKLSNETRHLIWLGVIASFVLIPLAWLLLSALRFGPRVHWRSTLLHRLAAVFLLSADGHLQLFDQARALVGSAFLKFLRTAVLVAGSIWATGALALAARVAVGKGAVKRLAAQARGNARLLSRARRLGADSRTCRNLKVLLSAGCSIPFTFGVRRPVILLPEAAATWPARQLRAALTHELAHIQRHDVLLQSLCYGLCVLFWFAPPLWLAYAAMLREAESCCDQKVVNSGIDPVEFARGILELARSHKGRILLPSASSFVGSMSGLQVRIRNLLELKPGRRPLGPRGAARILALFLACVVPALAFSAQPKPQEAGESDPRASGKEYGRPDRRVIAASAIGQLPAPAVGMWIDAAVSRWHSMRSRY
jgi:beta-lactamase regulating signal transducer with metallopeptidase domain